MGTFHQGLRVFQLSWYLLSRTWVTVLTLMFYALANLMRYFGRLYQSGPSTAADSALRQQNPEMPIWFEDEEFKHLVKTFHDAYAQFPKSDISRANRRLEEIMEKISKNLQDRNICERLKCTGSSYEGLKIASSPLEYDMMCILKHGEYLQATRAQQPGYVLLSPTKYHAVFEKRLVGGRLSPTRTRSWFYGQLVKSVSNMLLDTELQTRDKTYSADPGKDCQLENVALFDRPRVESTTPHYHGPASQLNISHPDGTLWFSIDVVPAYEVDGQLYVAKPLSSSRSDLTWRRSFSAEEKRILQLIDADGGCRRQCGRILKAICDREATFQALPSYVIKTLLIQASQEQSDWRQKKLGVRLVDLMRRLSEALRQGRLDSAFIPGLNILPEFDPTHRRNIYTRLDRALNSRHRMRKLLSTAPL